VICATGVWTEQTEALTGSSGGLRVLASKGIHLVVPRERIRGEDALILQTEKSVLFLIPWPRYWLIGTTDTPWEQDLRHPAASGADVDYVLEHANAVLAEPLTRQDVIGVFAGLRPLLQPEVKAGTSSAKVSREHTVASPVPGFTVIAGGKLTTYRVMAADAVDFALGARARELPSVTAELPLVGADHLAVTKAQAARWAATYGWDAARVRHLLDRYGSLLSELVDLIAQQPDLSEPLAGAPAYLRVEARYAVTHEGALHLDDILMHRTRLNYEQADKGVGALQEIADLVGPALNWDDDTRKWEIEAYRERVAAENAAAQAGDDVSAEAARLTATDLTAMPAVEVGSAHHPVTTEG
ncbi:MAG: glycerol-3-phosphate dehydrogenase, partial [Micrococcales bacterium]|nr:glycerol-3-phosphate dehydrogenase [Micrococcales bacterium]